MDVSVRMLKRAFAYIILFPMAVVFFAAWIPFIPLAIAISFLNEWDFGKEDLFFPLYVMGVLK